jgi:hypothetical protein
MTLAPEMRGAFWFCVLAFAVLYALLLTLRRRVEDQAARVEGLYLALDE